jgi:hypothetical protein
VFRPLSAQSCAEHRPEEISEDAMLWHGPAIPLGLASLRFERQPCHGSYLLRAISGT